MRGRVEADRERAMERYGLGILHPLRCRHAPARIGFGSEVGDVRRGFRFLASS